MSDWRQESLTGAYRQLASGLSALLREYRQILPELVKSSGAHDMIAGALAQLEVLGVTAVYIHEEDQAGKWLDDQPPAVFSIEWVEASPGSCTICGAAMGTGPVGWQRGCGAVCDGCMLDHAWGLGSILLAVNVMREMGAIDSESDEDTDAATGALTTYARLYQRVAEDKWPHRPVGLLAYLRHLGEKFEQLVPNESDVEKIFSQGENDDDETTH